MILQKLLLRGTSPEDEDDVHEYTKRSMRFALSPGVRYAWKTRQVVARRLKAQQEWPRDEIDLAVELKSEHRVIGTVEPHKDAKSSEPIGYVFNRPSLESWLRDGEAGARALLQ